MAELEKIHVIPMSQAGQFQDLVKIRVENGYKVISSDCKVIHDEDSKQSYSLYTAIMELQD